MKGWSYKIYVEGVHVYITKVLGWCSGMLLKIKFFLHNHICVNSILMFLELTLWVYSCVLFIVFFLQFANKNFLISFSYRSDSQMLTSHHSVNPLFLLEGLNFLPNFQKRRGCRMSIFGGVCWEGGGDIFQGGCRFYIKMTKKVYKQKYFLCHN